MKNRIAFLLLFFLSGLMTSAVSGDQMGRTALIALMNGYLDALVKHDPSSVPLADSVKLVQNTKVTPIGEGLWKTATGGPTAFSIYVADSAAGQIGFLGVIGEKQLPTILGARLRIVDGKITEIDHLVIDAEKHPLNPNMEKKPRSGLVEPLKPSERIPRDLMLQIANTYYEAIVQDDGTVAPFADECQRRENGGTTANYDANSCEEVEKDDFYIFRKMKCGEQLSTGVMSYITDINRRRFIAADEKMGLVFAYSIFVHDGEPKIMKIKGVPGITERINEWGPFDLPAAHVFKIKNGMIYEIEAIGYIVEHGIKNGWE